MRARFTLLAACALALLQGGLAQAQEPGRRPGRPPQSPIEAETPGGDGVAEVDSQTPTARDRIRRDPTSGAIDPTWRGEEERGVPLPDVQIRARVLVPGQEPVALIEVNAGMYLVHEGSEITLQGQGYELTPTPGRFDDPRGRRSTYSSLTLRILRIDEREVRIELSRLNETITIR